MYKVIKSIKIIKYSKFTFKLVRPSPAMKSSKGERNAKNVMLNARIPSEKDILSVEKFIFLIKGAVNKIEASKTLVSTQNVSVVFAVVIS